MLNKKLHIFASFAVLCMPSMAVAGELNPDDLLNLSLEELTNIEVTSVSKKAEKQTEAAAAIYVITQDDIRRSGATEIPELLRGVPGVVVTQAGAHDWTVSARGFNDQFANKLLVLMDGRTIYSPLFSGVIWDAQDTMLEDIERIEVIRGPGATLWGANAVNGVINIITKSAKNTQGGIASYTAGNQINGIGGGRYGAKIGEDSYIRAYAKYTNYDEQKRSNGLGAGDAWNKQQAGFRSDSKLSDSADVTVQGDAYVVDENADYLFPKITSPTFTGTAQGRKSKGANILTRLNKKHSADSESSIQFYVDNASTQTSFFANDTTTVDFDYQNVWTRWSGHEVVWGAGYRLIHDRNDDPSSIFSLTPKIRNDNLFNAFVQDKFEVIDSVFLTLGSKFERNDYSGFEVQPSARASWLINDKQTLWGSVSRAVHTPSRFTDDGKLNLNIISGPVLIANAGNRTLDPEEMIAYEMGYRIQPTKSLSFDIAAFYNDYENHFIDVANPNNVVSMGTYFYQPVFTTNGNGAESKGIELASEWNVTPEWQTSASYSYIDLKFDNKSGGVPAFFVGKQPKHMMNLRSTYIFPNKLEMTNILYYSDQLSRINVDSYWRFDTRLSYPVMDGVDVSLVGQNLLDDSHQEFSPFVYTTAAEIQRSVYGNITFKF